MSPTAKKIDHAPPAVMTRKSLAKEVALACPGVSLLDANRIVQTAVHLMTRALIEGRSIQFRDLGVLEVVTRCARPGRNPRQPDELYQIPERKAVRFRTGVFLKKALNPRKANRPQKLKKAKK
jgi:DNA-binding protein HU-beta